MKTNINDNESTSYTLKSVNKNKFRTSGLYFTLVELLKNRSNLLSGVQIQRLENPKSVFYISFNTPQYIKAFNEYEFKERHLTIHKYFKEFNNNNYFNGLTIAHYTENYNHSTQNKSIVVHIYFDKQGFYQYIRVKQFDGEHAEKKFSELTINRETQELFRENSKDISLFLKELLNLNYSFYSEALLHAAAIENKLEKLSVKLSKNSKQLYIEVAGEFILAIEKVNRFSDGVEDKRGIIVADQIAFLQESFLSEEVKPTTSENDEAKQAIATSTHIATKQTKKQIILEQEKQLQQEMTEIESHLNALSAKFAISPNDINLLIQYYQFIKSSQLKLLQISSIVSSKIQSHVDNFDLFNKASQCKATLLSNFIQFFWEYNLDVVKDLYPYVEPMLDYDVICGIFFKLLDIIPVDSTEELKLKLVFNFLHQECSTYRFILSSQAAMLFSTQFPGHFVSLLTKSCIMNNLFAFRLLLEHGTNPNCVGILIENIQIPTFYYITAFSDKENRSAFIETSLKFGAHYSCKSGVLNIDMKKTKKFAPENAASVRQYLNFKSVVNANFHQILTSSKNVIEWCVNNNASSSIKPFLYQLNLEDSLYTLAILALRQQVVCRHVVTSKSYGCKVAESPLQLDTFTAEILDVKAGLYSVIIYSDQSPEIIDTIAPLVQQLQDKIRHLAATDPAYLQTFNERQYVSAKTLNYSCNNNSKYPWQYDACFFLLILNPNPTSMIYQTIMQIFCYKAAFFKNNPKWTNDYNIYYRYAKNLAEGCRFSEELKITPLYSFVSEKLGYSLNDKQKLEVGKPLGKK